MLRNDDQLQLLLCSWDTKIDSLGQRRFEWHCMHLLKGFCSITSGAHSPKGILDHILAQRAEAQSCNNNDLEFVSAQLEGTDLRFVSQDGRNSRQPQQAHWTTSEPDKNNEVAAHVQPRLGVTNSLGLDIWRTSFNCLSPILNGRGILSMWI